MNRTRSTFLALIAIVLCPMAADADVIGIGVQGNCIPFGCGAWGPEYQQLYDASLFGSSLSIESLSFYNTVFDSGVYDLNSGLYDLYLSTTSVSSLSANLSDNVGADDLLVYSGLLPSSSTGAFGGQFDFLLSSVFNYDPLDGNLLLRVVSFDANTNTSNIFLDRTDLNMGLSRAYTGGSSAVGLVTGFNEATAVPEPGTLALFGIGFAAFGLCRRKRQN